MSTTVRLFLEDWGGAAAGVITPHTADQIASDNWNRPYTREAAAFSAKSLRDYKFWPPVARVDNVFSDRNLFCSCVGIKNYTG